jgi:hypothetical protein
MEAYRFETIVSESGVVKIPLLNSLLNQEVEVIIIPKNDHSLKNDNVTAFIKKWSGFLSNVQSGDPKWEYLSEKHK